MGNKKRSKGKKGWKNPPPQNATTTAGTTTSGPTVQEPRSTFSAQGSNRLQPEQMSLEAYDHIQQCLRDTGNPHLSKEEVTAVVQLSQHLRVFGLLSAVGYIRHKREGEMRKLIRPIWTPLLWRLVCGTQPRPDSKQQVRQDLMNTVYTLSTHHPKRYMVLWRQALKLSNYWNFWARAYQEEKQDEKQDEQADESTENGNAAG